MLSILRLTKFKIILVIAYSISNDENNLKATYILPVNQEEHKAAMRDSRLFCIEYPNRSFSSLHFPCCPPLQRQHYSIDKTLFFSEWKPLIYLGISAIAMRPWGNKACGWTGVSRRDFTNPPTYN